KLPEGVSISLQLKSNQLLLTSERSKFTFGTLPVDDFPSIDAKPLPHKFALPANDLRNLIDRTRFAISTEETRYYLNGIYFHAAQNNDVPVLRSVATDGHRLARVEMPLPEGAGSIPGVIIPRKAVNEVRKLLEGADVSVEISLSETQIRFQLNNILLTSKLIDGTFPDYERVIPRENDKIMEIDRRILAQAVDRVATVAAEKTRAIKLSLNPGTLVLSASSADQGTATEELEVNYRADPIEIGFNSRYLLDIAQQMDGDGACFEMSGADAPTIVRDLTDTSALYVLMPMRV
ncbi:MAG: DNA polymerase III subunit beta, partial [Dongiaceae bacterium]